MNLIDKNLSLYVRSMGKALLVTGIFADDNAANEYMGSHREDAVVAVSAGGLVFTANVYDKGARVEPYPPEMVPDSTALGRV